MVKGLGVGFYEDKNHHGESHVLCGAGSGQLFPPDDPGIRVSNTQHFPGAMIDH